MPTHLALLRGINVGKAARLPMAQLREIAEALGWRDVGTYVQSGNLVFTGTGEPAGLASLLQTAIAEQTKVQPAVVVLAAADWVRVIADLPFPEPEDPRLLHAYVQQDDVTPSQSEAMAALRDTSRESGSDDDLRVVGRVAYLATPGGYGRSALAEKLARDRASGTAQMTARNWRSVLALQELLRS